jgi:hypothetical protein
MRRQSADVVERFQSYVGNRKVRQLENKDQLLEDFAAKEDRRRIVDNTSVGALTLFGGGTFASFFVAFELWHVAFFLATLASAALALRGAWRRVGGYLGRRELRETK